MCLKQSFLGTTKFGVTAPPIPMDGDSDINKILSCSRGERTVTFYDPDPVLNIYESVQDQTLSKNFFKCGIQLQIKSKKLTKYSFSTTKIMQFFSINQFNPFLILNC